MVFAKKQQRHLSQHKIPSLPNVDKCTFYFRNRMRESLYDSIIKILISFCIENCMTSLYAKLMGLSSIMKVFADGLMKME